MAGLEWYEIAGRLLLAAALGAAIGLEREFDGQDAGFRTHLLVVVGSALFGVTSVGAFDAFVAPRGSTNVAVDVTRIAAYVAPGIGFIGGGAILKHGGKVSGITTAASLWTAAAVGVACGLGFWIGALVTSAIALLALLALEPLGDVTHRLGRRRSSAIAIELADDADLGGLVDLVEELSGERGIRSLRYGTGPDDAGQLTVELWQPLGDETRERVVVALAGRPGVRSVTDAANG